MSTTLKEKVILADMASFITWCIETDQDLKWCLSNVSHDCYGLVIDGLGFLPRTTGYGNILDKSHL